MRDMLHLQTFARNNYCAEVNRKQGEAIAFPYGTALVARAPRREEVGCRSTNHRHYGPASGLSGPHQPRPLFYSGTAETDPN